MSAYQLRHTDSIPTPAYCRRTNSGILSSYQLRHTVSIPTTSYCQHTNYGILTAYQLLHIVSIPTTAYFQHTNHGILSAYQQRHTVSQFLLVTLLNCEYNPLDLHSPKLQWPVLYRRNQQNWTNYTTTTDTKEAGNPKIEVAVSKQTRMETNQK